MLTEIMKANLACLKNIDFTKDSSRFDELAMSLIGSYIDSVPVEKRRGLREIQFKICLKKLLNIDYKKEPEMFERFTKITIENFIKSQEIKNQARAFWLQSKTERELRKFPTPLGRWQRMQEIFITEVFEKEGGFISLMSQFNTKRDGITPGTKTVNEITPLRLVTSEKKDI